MKLVDLPAGRHAGLKLKKYALLCLCHKKYNKNYIYIGISNNCLKKIKQHNDSKKIIKARAPFKLIYIEKHPSRKAARIREKYFKSGYGKEIIKKLI